MSALGKHMVVESIHLSVQKHLNPHIKVLCESVSSADKSTKEWNHIILVGMHGLHLTANVNCENHCAESGLRNFHTTEQLSQAEAHATDHCLEDKNKWQTHLSPSRAAPQDKIHR